MSLHVVRNRIGPTCHRALVRTFRQNVRTFTTRTTHHETRPRILIRMAVNFLKMNLSVVFTPIKTVAYTAGAYGVFCVSYSWISPREWNLSDHNVLLVGIVRFVRTVCNAALIMAVYKWSYWNVVNPFEEDDNPMDRQNRDKTDEELTPEQKKYREIQHSFWEFAANRIASVMLTNGGSYIKIGQGMATYSSMLPQEFATALKPLLSNIFERQSGEVDHMFVQDLGGPPEELFAEFKRDPIAGASIAQVFLGKTKAGQKVAIKVQYFDIAKRFKMDKGTCLFLLNVLDWFIPGIPFLNIMPHVFDSLEKELDFVSEAYNSETCKNELKDLDFLYVPAVHKRLSSKRILTMDFAEGISLVDIDKVKAAGHDTKEIMTKVIRIFSEQIFRTGTVHSDPHPGNILVRKNKSGKLEVVVIDHGLYERLPLQYRQAFASFWHSVIIDDYEEVQRSGKLLGLNYPDMMATLLFFKPYGKMKKLGFGGMHGEKRKKIEDMTEEEKKEMEEIRHMGHDTLDSLPKELALVFRNLRLIQGINLSFGVPVNRVRLMAEIAVRNSKKNEDFITNLKSQVKFEWHFFVLDVRNRILSWMLWVYSWFVKREEGKVDMSQAALFLKA